MNVKTAWRNAYRQARVTRATGRELYEIILAATGGSREAWHNMTAQRFQSCLASIQTQAEPERFTRTRDILNQFGRLNPWKFSEYGARPAAMRDAQRVRSLRTRLLARRMVAPEPGGYVTGLLSVAPSRFWWHDYPRPVAALSVADVALYEGRAS